MIEVLQKKLSTFKVSSTPKAQRVLGIAQRVFSDRMSDLHKSLGIKPNAKSFGSSYAALDQWLEAAQKAPAPSGERIGVYLLRNRYWAEFAAYACCRLQLMGHDPVLLYSGQETGKYFTQRLLLDVNLRGFWRKLRENDLFELMDIDAFVSDLPPEEFDEDTILAARITAAYDTGNEHSDSPEEVEHYAAEIARVRSAARNAATHLKLTRAILPSGIIGTSAGVARAFADIQLPYIAIEGWGLRPGHMIWNLNRPALHFDYSGWFSELEGVDEGLQASLQARMASYIAFQDNPTDARAGAWRELRSAQPISIQESAIPTGLSDLLSSGRPLALLGTNVVGDSATLGKETIFPGQIEWLKSVIEWFRERPELGLVLRVHPEEAINRTPMPLGPIIRAQIQGLPNIALVDADEKLNTFALAPHIRVGLLWVSNLGVDLAARGVQVISAARAPYNGLGIAAEPNDTAAYFEALSVAISEEPVHLEQTREIALRQMFVFTHLLSLSAQPIKGARFLPLSSDLDDAQALFFRILAGEAGRAEHLDAALKTLA